MRYKDYDVSFWQSLDQVIASKRIVIDRPRGSSHPRHPDIHYPIDYGYVEGVKSTDGNELDVWRGSEAGTSVTGILSTVDLRKMDVELKILLSCSHAEMDTIYQFHNKGSMNALIFRRQATTRQ